MNDKEWIDEDYWNDEFDIEDDDEFVVDDKWDWDFFNDYENDDDEDDYEDSGGTLVPNRPEPFRPLFGAEVEPERELELV